MITKTINVVNQTGNLGNTEFNNTTESIQPTSFQINELDLEGIKKRNSNSDSVKNVYPVAVVFILGSKFFESFAANGIRTVLALFLRDYLHYDEDFSTTVLHIFNFISQFVPLFGALIADSYLGNSRTIFYIFFVYGIGYGALCLVTVPFSYTYVKLAAFSALTFIAIGNGGIRACVASLGAEQFTLPQQQKALNKYFSQYYFFYTCGILLSKIIPPLIRSKFSCFASTQCYFAVFIGISACFSFSWLIFLIGYPFYKSEKPTGKHILINVSRCIWLALWNKIKLDKKETNEKKHWLNYTSCEFEDTFIEGVKIFFKLLLLFLPIPVYFALTAQQDSTWTFQATQLNTDILGIFIQPDQVKVLGPFLLLLNILLFDKIIYPLLKKFGLELRPLQKIGIGAIMATIAFLCTGLLQTSIEKNEQRYFEFIDSTIQSYKIYNSTNEPLLISNGMFYFNTKCSSKFLQETQIVEFNNSMSKKTQLLLIKTDCDDHFQKLISLEINNKIILSQNETGDFNLYLLYNHSLCYFITINLNNSYTLIFHHLQDNAEKIELYKNPYKKLSVIWQVPQFFLLMLGEIFLAIPGLQFAFTQAPDNMKSVLVAMWFINNALGNLIVVIISEIHIAKQSYEFYLYAVIMLLSTVIFIFLSKNYTYIDKLSSPSQNQSPH